MSFHDSCSRFISCNMLKLCIVTLTMLGDDMWAATLGPNMKKFLWGFMWGQHTGLSSWLGSTLLTRWSAPILKDEAHFMHFWASPNELVHCIGERGRDCREEDRVVDMVDTKWWVDERNGCAFHWGSAAQEISAVEDVYWEFESHQIMDMYKGGKLG